jgi:hypothetical protein
MKGKLAEKDLANPHNDLAGDFEIFLAFDGGEKIRFDQQRPGWVIDSGSIRPDPTNPQALKAESKKGTLNAKYYRTKRKSAYWVAGTPAIHVGRPDSLPPREALSLFDVRALGLYSWVELQRGYTFPKLVEHYLRLDSDLDVNDSDRDQWVLTWSYRGKNDEAEWRIWVNVAQGFTPVRAEQRERWTHSGQQDWTVVQSFETKWDRIENVWVPVVHEMLVTPYKSKARWERSFTIAWELVNRPVREELFDHKTFGAPDSVGVTDRSLGQPVIVRPYQLPPGMKIPEKQGQAKRAGFGFWVVVGSNALLLLGGAAFLLYKRRATRTG